jgi:heptosyltransferase III
MKRVLVLRPGGLGDLVITLPSIRLLRRTHPDVPLHLAAGPEQGAVLAAAGVVDRVFDLGDRTWAPLFSEASSGLDPLPGGPTSAIWSWFLKPPAAAFLRNAASLAADGAHVLSIDPGCPGPLSRDFFERTAAAAGVRVGDDDFDECRRLPPIRPRVEPPIAGGFVLVHPGSGGRRKRWPLDRFLDLVGLLAGRGLPGLLVTGPAETDGMPAPERIPLPSGWRLVSSPPLVELAAWLFACRLFIGNDSGVTHLAAAVGAPTLAFFLDENLPAWRPFGRATVLSAASIDAISADAAREALRAAFPV